MVLGAPPLAEIRVICPSAMLAVIRFGASISTFPDRAIPRDGEQCFHGNVNCRHRIFVSPEATRRTLT